MEEVDMMDDEEGLLCDLAYLGPCGALYVEGTDGALREADSSSEEGEARAVVAARLSAEGPSLEVYAQRGASVDLRCDAPLGDAALCVCRAGALAAAGTAGGAVQLWDPALSNATVPRWASRGGRLDTAHSPVTALEANDAWKDRQGGELQLPDSDSEAGGSGADGMAPEASTNRAQPLLIAGNHAGLISVLDADHGQSTWEGDVSHTVLALLAADANSFRALRADGLILLFDVRAPRAQQQVGAGGAPTGALAQLGNTLALVVNDKWLQTWDARNPSGDTGGSQAGRTLSAASTALSERPEKLIHGPGLLNLNTVGLSTALTSFEGRTVAVVGDAAGAVSVWDPVRSEPLARRPLAKSPLLKLAAHHEWLYAASTVVDLFTL